MNLVKSSRGTEAQLQGYEMGQLLWTRLVTAGIPAFVYLSAYSE